MAANPLPFEPDVTIPDLVRRLGDDSKRLVVDEVQLAKLEVKESLIRGGQGALWLGAAFGVFTISMVLFTLFLATLIGRAVRGHMWVGALVTGAVEVTAAAVLVRAGIAAFGKPSYSMEQTRESLQRLV